MTTRNQRLCVWSGLIFMLLFGVGFVLLAQFIPAPAPTLSAAEVAAIYGHNTGSIRAGIALILLAAGFVAPWVAVISVQIGRIDRGSRALAYSQLISGGAAVVLFTITALLWATLAFRPERNPDLMLLLHDLAWLSLLTPVGPFLVQAFVIGLAILQDKNKPAIFPRWSGYLNFWTGLLFIPGVMGIFFKEGPFAWNGLFVFWIPFAVFGIWYIVMFFLLMRAISQQAAAKQA